MIRSFLVVLSLVVGIPAQFDRWADFASQKRPDLAFPNVLLNGTGDGMLSDLRGRSIVVVVIRLDSGEGQWAEAKRLLRRERDLSERGVEMVLWINQAKSSDMAARVFSRVPWFRGIVVAGGIPFTASPQQWVIRADGTNPSRMLNGADAHAGDWINRFLAPAITSAKAVRAGWGKSKAAKEIRGLAYGRGKLSRARNLALRQPESDERDDLLAEIDELFARRLRHVRHDIEEGRLGRARLAAEALVDDVKGWEPKEDVAHEALRPLTESAAGPALEFCRHLERWFEGIRAGRPSERDAVQLKRLLRKAPEGVVKDRGRRLLELVSLAAKVK